jgi:hypothetical protein
VVVVVPAAAGVGVLVVAVVAEGEEVVVRAGAAAWCDTRDARGL